FGTSALALVIRVDNSGDPVHLGERPLGPRNRNRLRLYDFPPNVVRRFAAPDGGRLIADGVFSTEIVVLTNASRVSVTHPQATPAPPPGAFAVARSRGLGVAIRARRRRASETCCDHRLPVDTVDGHAVASGSAHAGGPAQTRGLTHRCYSFSIARCAIQRPRESDGWGGTSRTSTAGVKIQSPTVSRLSSDAHTTRALESASRGRCQLRPPHYSATAVRPSRSTCSARQIFADATRIARCKACGDTLRFRATARSDRPPSSSLRAASTSQSWRRGRPIARPDFVPRA